MLDVILPPTCGSIIICYALICLHVLVLLMLLIWMMGKELLLDLSVDQSALFVKPTPVFHLLDQLSAEALQFGDSLYILLSLRLKLHQFRGLLLLLFLLLLLQQLLSLLARGCIF